MQAVKADFAFTPFRRSQTCMAGRARNAEILLEASLKKSMSLKRWPVLVGLAAVAGVAYAATQITISTPV
jgi:hypothetical protein